MAKQVSRRRTASSSKNTVRQTVRRAKARSIAQAQPAVDDIRDEIGSALTAVQRRGGEVYRSVENRFGRTPTLSMLTVAGAGLAIGALLLGMASAKAGQASSGRARRRA